MIKFKFKVEKDGTTEEVASLELRQRDARLCVQGRYSTLAHKQAKRVFRDTIRSHLERG